ncbi:hypothetical protein RYX36_031197 [Vicia faba]
MISIPYTSNITFTQLFFHNTNTRIQVIRDFVVCPAVKRLNLINSQTIFVAIFYLVVHVPLLLINHQVVLFELPSNPVSIDMFLLSILNTKDSPSIFTTFQRFNSYSPCCLDLLQIASEPQHNGT